MAVEVIDADKGQVMLGSEIAGESEADFQGGREARADGDSDTIEIGGGEMGTPEGELADGGDVLLVGEFSHGGKNAAVGLVEGDLGRDDVA